MTEWIAHRLLTLPNNTTLNVALGRPEPEADDVWRCTIRYDRGGVVTLEHVTSGDAFQALTNALGAIEQDLAGTGATWLPSHPGWTGFHKILPSSP